MENNSIKSGEILRFCRLASDAAHGRVLKRLTLSKPSSDAEFAKISFYLFKDGSDNVKLAFEGKLPDGKMIRKNYELEELYDLLLSLTDSYKQGDLSADAAQASYMISKKGKISLVGEGKVRAVIDGEGETEITSGVDRKKKYFFDGSENWLYELGISTKEGRVHDKKQSKFRQINRFTELLDDIYSKLPSEGTLNVCDLCCGKSYLSFAVYEYLTAHKKRTVNMLGIDRKRDVIDYCNGAAERIGATGLHFVAADISDDAVYCSAFGENAKVHLTVSLHACDIATDIVLRRAVEMRSEVILSTPCCHHELYGKIKSNALSFITSHSMLAGKFNDAVTDGLRVKMLETEGYKVDTVELVDPEKTPKNTLIRAVRRKNASRSDAIAAEYNAIVDFLGITGSYYDIYR